MGITKTHFIESIVQEGEAYFIQVEDDNDNYYLFEKMKYCRRPIAGFPVKLENDKCIPRSIYDAQINLKYHLIRFIDCKSEDNLKIFSVTFGAHYQITIKDLRPLRIKL